MDAKRPYTRLVQRVKDDIDKNKELAQRIAARNFFQNKYKDLWEKVNLDDIVQKFAPNSEPEISETGKIIFRTPGSPIQVVAEATIGSVRIEDTRRTGDHRYLNLDGIIPNNITINGKTRGMTKQEYRLATHFRIMKLYEMEKTK